MGHVCESIFPIVVSLLFKDEEDDDDNEEGDDDDDGNDGKFLELVRSTTFVGSSEVLLSSTAADAIPYLPGIAIVATVVAAQWERSDRRALSATIAIRVDSVQPSSLSFSMSILFISSWDDDFGGV